MLPTLAAVVALIAGPSPRVVCDTPPGLEAGNTSTDFATVTISPEWCYAWQRVRKPPDLAGAGIALLVAVHEAEHVRYRDGDEAVTECRAMRDLPAVIADAVRTPLRYGHGKTWTVARERSAMWDSARAFDVQLAPAYHGASC